MRVHHPICNPIPSYRATELPVASKVSQALGMTSSSPLATATSSSYAAMAPALFGDAFGTRGDYSKGVFYAGRRRYLGAASNASDFSAAENRCAMNPLKPPDYFLSRAQRQKQSLKSNGVRMFQRLDFKRDEDAKQTKPDAASKTHVLKPKKTFRRPSLLINSGKELSKLEWKQEFQAGVLFWVNHDTGEVLERSPWDNEEEMEARLAASERPDEDAQFGAIENKELGEFFDILDSLEQKRDVDTQHIGIVGKRKS